MSAAFSLSRNSLPADLAMAEAIIVLLAHWSRNLAGVQPEKQRMPCRSSKFQAPISREIPNFKHQTSGSACALSLVVAFWRLGLEFSLELGCWCLELFSLSLPQSSSTCFQTAPAARPAIPSATPGHPPMPPQSPAPSA